MTRAEAIKYLNAMKDECNDTSHKVRYVTHEEALDMAIQVLSQEPCELLIIKSDILLHQDDRKKWMESIKREKESGVIILPPYFEPLLVPADIEINIEQKSGKWIPVSERLPERDDLYLINFDDGEYELAYFSKDAFELAYFSKDAFSYSGVIAWMPLPEPYEPQESEDKE